jgi:mannose-6-phosphate isomerase-like protein (cupin superfamily)
MSDRTLLRCLTVLVMLILASMGVAQQQPQQQQAPAFLQRSVSEVKETADDLSAEKVHYRPLFGLGDSDAAIMKGVARFGEVTVDPGGTTKTVSYDREEQAWFVVQGSGTLLYGEEKAPIKQNDFVYLPVGVKHGLANAETEPLRVLIMGYTIPEGRQVPPTTKQMLATADDVQLQILGQHGPTTQFKLLMGPTRSTRDKLAAAQQISSLFMMDFAPGGTNIPHTHPSEEEIYYVLRGKGDMVAGGTAEQPARHPCKEGDAFYFPPNTLVGYYSNAKEGQPHDLIVAIRSSLPPGARGRGAAGQTNRARN